MDTTIRRYRSSIRTAAIRAIQAIASIAVISATSDARAQTVTPLGGEILVNSYTPGGQRSPAVAMGRDGGFVVVWEDLDVLSPGHGRDGSLSGVFGRRFDPAGVALAAEFQVNTYTRLTQGQPAVDMNAEGGFVVVWTSGIQDGSGSGVFARRFDAAANGIGSELQVNLYTPNEQDSPVVRVESDGDFVVAWSSSLEDGAAEGVFARRFASSGAGLGVELQINLRTTGAQTSPSLAVDGVGGFVVAWASETDGYDFGVFARRFDSAGSPRGGELQVNVRTEDVEKEPSLAIGPDGGFVVVWTRTGGDSTDTLPRVFARLFDAKGVPRTAEIPVPPVVPARSQPFPAAVAMDGSGAFIVTWDEETDDAFARLFDAKGAPLGPAFQVNSYTPFSQYLAAVDMNDGGDFVVTWTTQRAATDLDVGAQRGKRALPAARGTTP